MCLKNDNKTVIFCHGQDLYRAAGLELDPVFTDIKNFMDQNPHEIITLEFGHVNDLSTTYNIIAHSIQSRLEKYFTNSTTGHSQMLILPSASSKNESEWPTLRQMIETDQRIVIWFVELYDALGNDRKPWINQIDPYYVPSFSYTKDAFTAQQLNASFIQHCNNSTALQADDLKVYGYTRWQTIDNT
ncbi:19289_t:CDS:1 [Racocetra fulgida]|uniref:19289_t:CDS:1 n=1 Tax=Racocetra fulgida TaxID=60492 RepID=A0A9N9FM88_9GLOM|nr:19289_t:CDS:1 [Racocetra fulgida]